MQDLDVRCSCQEMAFTRPFHAFRRDTHVLAGSARRERATSIDDDSVLSSCTQLLLYRLEVVVDDILLEAF